MSVFGSFCKNFYMWWYDLTFVFSTIQPCGKRVLKLF